MMLDYKNIFSLKFSYSQRKKQIQERLIFFKSIFLQDEKIIFAELCFCLLTPQSKARSCDLAVKQLLKTNFLYSGTCEQIKSCLKGVRFHNNKARYIFEARTLFYGSLKTKILTFKDYDSLRSWLVEHVKGIGYKESVHFMRNIGIFSGLAILDRHILKNLVKYGVLATLPKNLNRKNYLKIEKKMKNFALVVGISMEELDLLFWSEETGEVFK